MNCQQFDTAVAVLNLTSNCEIKVKRGSNVFFNHVSIYGNKDDITLGQTTLNINKSGLYEIEYFLYVKDKYSSVEVTKVKNNNLITIPFSASISGTSKHINTLTTKTIISLEAGTEIQLTALTCINIVPHAGQNFFIIKRIGDFQKLE